jgi:hypothetical protein
MRGKNRTFVIWQAGLFLFVAFTVLIGCQTTSNRYIGKAVQEPNRISLSEGKPFSGIWQAKDMVFQYTGNRKPGKLSLTGELTLDKSYDRYSIVDYLYFWIHFLDSEGNILDTKLALSVVSQIAYTGEEKKWSVASNIDLPVDVTAVTFSYRGVVLEDVGGSDRWRFYKSPLT